MVLPQKFTPIQQALQAAKVLAGVDNSIFVCFRCQRIRRVRFWTLVGIGAVIIVTILVLERLGIVKGETRTEETHWDNGKLRAQSVFYLDAAGKKILHGIQKDGFENGQLRLSIEYVEGLRQGVLTEWYPDGQKAREGSWIKDHETGLWAGWQPSGEKEWEAIYKDGRIVGKKVYWATPPMVVPRPPGPRSKELVIVREENYDATGDMTEVVKYHYNGKQSMRGLFTAGKKNGTWTYWDKSGEVLADGVWKDGAPWSGSIAFPQAGDASVISEVANIVKYQNGEPVK
jgi:antitoxin component YwqK of YwqJK toxin-antitoxin module